MGTMIDGAWHKDGDERSEADGRFVRATTSLSQHRHRRWLLRL